MWLWLHGITTIKSHHVAPFKWMPFIAHALYTSIKLIFKKKPRERIEWESKRSESKSGEATRV